MSCFKLCNWLNLMFIFDSSEIGTSEKSILRDLMTIGIIEKQ